MVNINSYFEIDWPATKHNLKSMLYERTTEAALAKALHVEGRTIRYWLDGETDLHISRLIVFAKFLDVDLLDILITKGQHNHLTRDEVLDSIHNLRPDDCSAEAESDHSSAADFISTVLMNEYSSQKTALRKLNDFLVYFPLFNPLVLKDIVYRMQGNFNQRTYLQSQLQRLYECIPDSPAKRYADSFCYYTLTSPSVYHIKQSSEKELFKQKLVDFEAWRGASSTQDEYADYKRAVRIFLKRLTTFEQLELFLKDLSEDGDNNY